MPTAAEMLHAAGLAVLMTQHGQAYTFRPASSTTTASRITGIRRRPMERTGPLQRGLDLGPEYNAEIDFEAASFAATGIPKTGDNITEDATGDRFSVVTAIPAGHVVTVRVRL